MKMFKNVLNLRPLGSKFNGNNIILEIGSRMIFGRDAGCADNIRYPI
tara:strand:- start:67 stop:207 length:141 start_codon:yes stop_codon:yes gene_type:complete